MGDGNGTPWWCHSFYSPNSFQYSVQTKAILGINFWETDKDVRDDLFGLYPKRICAMLTLSFVQEVGSPIVSNTV